MGEPSAAPVAEKKPLQVELVWQGDLRYRGQAGDLVLNLDSDAKDGVSPMQALAFALAGCMGMDLVHILTKGRFELRSVKASLTGRRPQEPPSRFTAVTLHFAIAGNPPDDQVERAIQLSREKYCSVWNSMRQDIDFVVTFVVDRG